MCGKEAEFKVSEFLHKKEHFKFKFLSTFSQVILFSLCYFHAVVAERRKVDKLDI
jgi:hypothetical protein